MRKLNIATMLVAFALLAALPAMTNLQSAYAEPKDKIILRDNGSFANAFWHEEAPDGTIIDTALFVSETERGTDIFLDRFFVAPDGTFTSQFGYVFTTEDVFDISKKLQTATLSPINIEVFTCGEFDCTSEILTVDAQWTGVGELTKTKFKSSFTSENFRVKFSESTSFRQATATGTIGEQSLGDSIFAELGSFKRAEMQSGQL